jgi:V/A-type H+-transporting ATPase subunit K
MIGFLVLMAICVAALVAVGVFLELRPGALAGVRPAWLKAGVLADMLVFGLAVAGALLVGVEEVLAQQPAGVGGGEISLGMGLALIGVGLPTALAAIGAGIALGPVGSAALAVIAEKPEMFGRTLVYLGLAEGIAIYGLVMSILLLGKL